MMTHLEDLRLDEIITEVVDENGFVQEVTLRQALALSYQKELSKDKALGITRNCTHLIFTLLPDQPQTPDFSRLANAISRIAVFDFAPDNQAQAIWMRCVQLYWQAKSMLLPNKIFKLIPDPTEIGGSVQKMLPAQALKNLKLDTDVDKALYELLKAGDSEIISWAETKGINYPFSNFEELFIHILKLGFIRGIQEDLLRIKPLWTNQRDQKQHYRGWLKFLNDHDLGEEVEKKYSQLLMDMEWEGYILLALKNKKTDKKLKKLWRLYLKAYRALIEVFDTQAYWINSIPYKTKKTNQRLPIKASVTEDGFFEWHWR
ncbi:MAG TPA: hypothetical protein VK203_10015 [Nostocaceae cyanobacterium]|nr:hypothetical protein [Nostocaceae cyanobacterium]